MRALLLEVGAVGVGAIVTVAALLGLLQADGPLADATWIQRTGHLLAVAITGQFGRSTREKEWVVAVARDASVTSLTIVATTTLLLLLVAVPIGIWCGRRPELPSVARVRRLVESLSSIPVLVWSTFTLLLCARAFSLFLKGDDHPTLALIGAIVTLTLGDRVLADLIGRVELRTREILAEPYMRTVQAAGFGTRRHLFQGLVPAVAEAVASRALFLIGGAIVAEQVFDVRGLGLTVVRALDANPREPLMILACAIPLVAITLSFRVAQQLAVFAADPRTRT